jgi:hypothetical protein
VNGVGPNQRGGELEEEITGRNWGLLLLAVFCLGAVAPVHAQKELTWDAPLDFPVRVDGYRVYEDGLLLGEPNAATLSWPIDVSDNLQHIFGVSAIHRDDATNVVTESDATIITFIPPSSEVPDTVPPIVTLSVSQSSGLSGAADDDRNEANYQATATATDDVNLERIELSLDSTLFATCYSSPCSATVSINAPGSHVIVAVAWDGAGNKAAAASIVER